MSNTVLAFFMGLAVALAVGLVVLGVGWRRLRVISSDWIRSIGVMMLASLACNYALVTWLGVAFGLPNIAPLVAEAPLYATVMVAMFFGIMAGTTTAALRGIRMLTEPPEGRVTLWDALPYAVAPVGASVFVMLVLSLLQAPAPPFRFIEAVPKYSVICEDDPFIYSLEFEINVTDHAVRVDYADSWHRVDGFGLVGETDGVETWVYPQSTQLLFPNVRRPLPDNVGVGEWLYVGHATTPGRAATTFTVPFSVVRCD